MRDLATELREYIDSFDAPFDPDELIGKAEAIRRAQARMRQSTRRGLAVAMGAASVVLAVAGLILLGAGLIGDVGTPIADSAPTAHTALTTPAPTAQTTPAASVPSGTGTSVPTSTIPPPLVEGTWTMYATESGLPAGGMSGLAVGHDGTVWAAQEGSEGGLYRFDGTRWTSVGVLGVGYWNWMIATPDGGVAIGVQNQIFHFDGERWFDPIYTGCDFAAVVDTADGAWILGYSGDFDLMAIRFVDDTFEIRTATRVEKGGSAPSVISVWDTVDVDSAGNAWFGTVEGAWRFDGDSLELFEFGVVGDCCAPLAVDTDDNVWTLIETHGDQYRLSADGERTRYTPDDGIPFLHEDENPIILPTADGSVWVLNRAGDAARFDGATWAAFTAEEAYSAGIPAFGLGSSFGVVDGPDGSTWTVRRGETPVIHRFFGGTWQMVSTPGTSWGLVGADYGTLGMAVAPDGSLWIPTSTGVARFQPTGG